MKNKRKKWLIGHRYKLKERIDIIRNAHRHKKAVMKWRAETKDYLFYNMDLIHYIHRRNTALSQSYKIYKSMY